MPSGDDSTLSRQAVRSGYPRLSVLTFDATALVKGKNTITFTRAAAGGGNNNTGMGYDTVLLEVDVAAAPPAVLVVKATIAPMTRGRRRWKLPTRARARHTGCG
jgi:rhamnogalacturonan endolyase